MPQPGRPMVPPPSPRLSESQLARLAELGEQRTADVGEVLYRIGDRDYPFMAIVDGEVAILDAAGNEILRHGPSGFLGELNLLSGQTVFVTAVVTEPVRYIAVARELLRSLLYEDGPLSDVVLSALIAKARRAPAGPGNRSGDRWAALVQRDHADGRLRAQQSPARDVARH
jgi:thioredoxin reductase (NADPH)